MKTSGIYRIINTKNKHSYIGQSVDIQSRIKSHFTELAKGRHGNSYLQHAFNKYGVNSFTYEVLEECRHGALNDREQYWIERLEPEYNIQKNVFELLYDRAPDPYIPRGEETFSRPEWHKWVYGAERNPVGRNRK